MAHLGAVRCKRLNSISNAPSAKPKVAMGQNRPRFSPRFKVLLGEPQPMRGKATKAESIKRKEKVVFVLFSQKETNFHKAQIQAGSSASLDMKNAFASSSSTQKGLRNKGKGKFDQLWMVKWFDWYKYVVAMHLKPLAVTLINQSKSLLSNVIRAESAKTAHAG